MVAACRCHDPAAFGHGDRCELDRGPVSLGGAPYDPAAMMATWSPEYHPPGFLNTSEIRALPAACICSYAQSRVTGLWRLLRRNGCPVH